MKNYIFIDGIIKKKCIVNSKHYKRVVYRLVSKDKINKLRFLKHVCILDEEEGEEFIKVVGWREDLKIGMMTGFEYVVNQFHRIKCTVLYATISDNYTQLTNPTPFSNLKCLIAKYPMFITNIILELVMELHNRGVEVILPSSWKMDNISSSIAITDKTVIDNCNKNARELTIWGSVINIYGIFEYFTNIRILHIFSCDIILNNVELCHPNLTKLRELYFHTEKRIPLKESVMVGICDLIRNNKDLYVLACYIENDTHDSMIIDALRDHPRLRCILGNNSGRWNSLLAQAKQLDREYRYRYVKVAPLE